MMDITIKGKKCMICGEEITTGNRIKAHLIPKRLKPKYNVYAFFHKGCEQRINQLYVNQQIKSNTEKMGKKALNILADFKTKINIMEEKIKEENVE